MVNGSGAGKSDMRQLIKKDWAMTLSFVLICIKGKLVSGTFFFAREILKNISFWGKEIFTMILINDNRERSAS